ncbi:GNAT family N-acetyltransferase [Actinophytocola sp.]|uniref:GNAT family N-acetyltransferase n=1 Tax=Actinophytocola sp. TaxID=1872138 RepID=UPI002ED423FE
MKTVRLTCDDWQTLRDVRLAALADAPYAYGSTLEREQSMDESEWRRRLESGLSAVAVDGAETVGLIGAYLPEPDRPMLIGLWVDPAQRGRGVGDALVTEVLRWAAENGWSEVVLRVADGNDAARKLFLRLGFTATGVREPLESNPGVGTETLSRAI